MPVFSLVIEYLTGYAVATDPASRERAEWPPHPARVFMAMAAAHYEGDGGGDQKRDERAALDWLATLGPPKIALPQSTPRDVLSVYVPVNDQAGGDALTRRSRQPRAFPRVHVGATPVRLIWESPPDASRYFAGLELVCRQVTRIGHSSSLVWVRLERESGSIAPTLVPDEQAIEHRLRVVTPGAMERLDDAYNGDAIEAFAALDLQIAQSKGPELKKLKAEQKKKFPHGEPFSRRPVVAIHHGYREEAETVPPAIPSVFDPNFIVLKAAAPSQTLGLESTAAVTDALRGLLLAHFGGRTAPPWLSGHEENGDKLRSRSHMALIPLPFIGHQHADGHLLGLGICVPRDVPSRDRARALGAILFDEETNLPRQLTLTLGRAGVWGVERDTDLAPRHNLRTSVYTTPSRSWASVTPVVLDRIPKANRQTDPLGWRQEVAEIVSRSCENVGLPQPVSVRTEKTPFFIGSLRAMPGQGGFPQLRKEKFQVHVALEFDEDVGGPLLLGAGRFRGYGLMRPWSGEAL